MIVWVCLWMPVSPNVFGQETKSVLLDYEADKIELDVYGNIYILSTSGVVYKYDSLLNEQAKSPKYIGHSELSLEVTNPLRVLLFDSNKQSIRVYDRRLSSYEDFSLGQEQGEVSLVAMTNGSSVIWCFVEDEMTLTKYDWISKRTIINFDLFDLLEEKEEVVDIAYYQNMITVLTDKRLFFIGEVSGMKKEIKIEGDYQEIKVFQHELYLLSTKDVLSIFPKKSPVTVKSSLLVKQNTLSYYLLQGKLFKSTFSIKK